MRQPSKSDSLLTPVDEQAAADLAAELRLRYWGDTIERLFETVFTLSDWHDCDKCGKTTLPIGHDHCISCESALMLRQCTRCLEWYCKTGCFQKHVCGAQSEYENRLG
jgi:hypothetical protein